MRISFQDSFTRMLVPFFVFLLTIPLAVFAVDEPQQAVRKGHDVKNPAPLVVADPIFGTAAWSSQTVYGVQNLVSFEIDFANEDKKYFYNQTFTATCNVSIKAYRNPANVNDYASYNNIDLQVNYNPASGTTYKGQAVYKFDGAYKVEVVVNSLNATGINVDDYPIFMLTNKLVVNRQYNFVDVSSHVAKYKTDGKKLEVLWTPTSFPGAESFDLEWTYVDEFSQAGAAILAAKNAGTNALQVNQLESYFRNNSSRVNLAGSRYEFNLNYNKGFLLFRIRGVQFRQTDGLRVEGSWNYSAQPLPGSVYSFFQQGIVDVDWHEQNLNWQYNAVYAEEGKKKEVITYSDGSLRSRQTVTLNNEDKSVVVAEPVYDALGRAAMNILPAPWTDNKLQYYPLFNLNNSGKPVSYKDIVYGNCTVVASPLSSSSGAERYYSSNNPFLFDVKKPWNQAIPKAEGFPYAVTQFTPDNTGRIRAQGGVGKDFQLGSNHETKYYYGKPSPYELYRLFGAEVGDHTHYLKNMVVDANKQVSVSYVNSEGKTIATAFAGKVPDNVEPLNSAAEPTTIVKDVLLTPSSFQINNTRSSLEATATFLVSSTGNYKFTYRFTADQYKEKYNNNTQTLCYSCSYDLLLTLKDECGNVLLTKELKKVRPFGTTCLNSEDISESLNIALGNVGEYTVYFELLVNKEVLDAYTEHYLVTNTDIKKLNHFLLEQLIEENLAECYSDCEACKTLPETEQEFIEKIKVYYVKENIPFGDAETEYAVELYNTIKKNCESISSKCLPSPCDEILEVIKADVSPGGQYAEYDADFKLVNPAINVLSNYHLLQYKDADGDPALVENENGQMVAPSQLTLKEFIQKFEDSWAISLASYHPEYCYYTWCTKNTESQMFNQRLEELNDPIEAKQQGLFDRANILALLKADPFFLPGGNGEVYYQNMEKDLLSYSSEVLGLTGQTVKNIHQAIDFFLYCASAVPAISWDDCHKDIDDPCRSDYKEWLLYKEWYLERKLKYYQLAMKEEMPECSNCFIPSSGGGDIADWTNCVAPSKDAFTISVVQNSTADGVKRILIKYKDGNEVVSWPLSLELYMKNPNGDVIQQPIIFAPGFGTQEITVQEEFDLFKIEGVSCAQLLTEDELGGRMQSTNRSARTAAIDWECPAPDGNSFSVSYTQNADRSWTVKTCYNGPSIPPGKLVDVMVVLETSCGSLDYIATFCSTNPTCHVRTFSEKEACEFIKDVRREAIECREEECAEECPTDPGYYNVTAIPLTNSPYTELKLCYNGATIPDGKTVVVRIAMETECGITEERFVLCSTSPACVSRLVNTENCGRIGKVWVSEVECGEGECGWDCPREKEQFTVQTYRLNDNEWAVQTCYNGDPIPTGKIINAHVIVNTACGTINYPVSFCGGGNICHTKIFTAEEVCKELGDAYVESWECTDGVCEWECPTSPSNYTTEFSQGESGQWDLKVCYTGPAIPVGKRVIVQVKANTGCGEKLFSFSFCAGEPVCKTITLKEEENCGYIESAEIVSAECSNTACEWVCPTSTEQYKLTKRLNPLTGRWEAKICYTGPPIPYNKTVVVSVNISGCAALDYEVKFCQGITCNTRILTPEQACDGNFEMQVREAYCIDASCSGNCPEQDEFSVKVEGAGNCTATQGYQAATIRVSPQAGTLSLNAPLSRVKLTLTVKTFDPVKNKLFTEEITAWMQNGDTYKDICYFYPVGRNIIDAVIGNIECKGNCPKGDCCDDPRYSLYDGKVRRFQDYMEPDFDAVMETLNNGNTNFTGYPLLICKNECEMMADGWIEQLKSCTSDLVKLERVRRKLIDVCKQSCVAQSGNATINPYSDVNPSPSFESVLLSEFGTITPTCSYDLISDPYPWGKAPRLEKTFATETNEKICQRLNQLRAEAQSHGYANDPNGLHQYLGRYYQPYYNLEEEEVADLFKGCDECKGVMPLPVELPLFMDGDAKPCKSCDEYEALKSQFLAKYPGITISHPKYDELLRNFINHKTGFSHATVTYYEFEEKCRENKDDFRKFNRLCETPLQMEANFDPLNQCIEEKFYNALSNATVIYTAYIEEVKRVFRNNYTTHCLTIPKPRLETEAKLYEYHYTLYYYDQSSNLVKTVPPEGVEFLSEGEIYDLMNNPNLTHVPEHKLATIYKYNSFNQVVEQSSPDGGTSQFWYDRLGRLVASQNEEQKNPINGADPDRYSYTRYEPVLGRITEVGEKSGASLNIDTKNDDDLQTWYNSGTDRQITLTIYDKADQTLVSNNAITSQQQHYTSRKRVVSTIFKKERYTTPNMYDAATHYSYDVNGNVRVLWQENERLKEADPSTQGLKRMDYDYDLVSGKVNRVYYQKGKGDQFIYKYEYDAENRVVKAQSSRDGLIWQEDATYRYYLHGPLARTEMGTWKVQGLDYAYTLQGWIKYINSPVLNEAADITGDGDQGIRQTNIFRGISRDVLAYSISYFNGEYKPIQNGSPLQFSENIPGSMGTGKDLFNGNIRATTVQIAQLGTPKTYSYSYDQLNRLVKMRKHETSYTAPTGSNGAVLAVASPTLEYGEEVTYDANGNIKSYTRNGVAARLAMDKLQYHYVPGKNQLDHVEEDPTILSTDYTEDLDNVQTAGNYRYDRIGNLVSDKGEKIGNIEWTVYGKIRKITKTDASATTIEYEYDAAGNRIYKKVAAGGSVRYTYYVRDAQGNTMAVYTRSDSKPVLWAEQHLYGSSRLGMVNLNIIVPSTAPLPAPEATLADGYDYGSRAYELSNHLGNVLATISDKKIGVDDGVYTEVCPPCPPPMPGTTSNCVCYFEKTSATADGIVDYFTAEVLNAQDYYPFGMIMPERTFSAGNGYRYGFQNQEKDNEIYGEGNAISFKYRVHDARLGRFLSIDPLTAKYPHNSPYAFSENRVIDAVELEGLEKVELKDLGDNAAEEKDKNGKGTGLYSVTIGLDDNKQTFSGVNLIQRGGNSYLDLTPHLKGQGLYWSSSSGFTTSNIGTEFKISIDDNIFDPPYDKNYDCEKINCAGLVFRQERHIGIDETKKMLSTLATPIPSDYKGKEGDVIVTLQEFKYSFGYYDKSGTWIQMTIWNGPDFHIVSAPLGPQGRALPNYISTNGRRPIYTGLWYNQAIVKDGDGLGSNDRYDIPMKFPNGELLRARFQMTITNYLMK